MISDADREQVVRELTRHCGDGRLTLDELEDRVGEAYAATTRDELRHALRELPSFRLEPAEPVEPVEPKRPSRPASAAVPAARRAWPAPAARCGVGRMGSPPVFLIALITVLFVTSHIFWAIVLLVFFLPKRMRRTYARA